MNHHFLLMALENIKNDLSAGYEKFAKRLPEIMGLLFVIWLIGADIVDDVRSVLGFLVGGVRDQVTDLFHSEVGFDDDVD